MKLDETTLTVGTDYTIQYSNNKDAGTATVRIIGIGNYTGEKSVTFTIDKADAKLNFAKSSITKNTADTPFTNTLTKITDGTVTFASSDTKVAAIDNTSGLVTIKGIGTAKITASATEGKNYKAGSAEYTLTVEAERMDISDLTVALSQTRYVYDGTLKQPTVTVKLDETRLTVGTDYTIQYSNNKDAGTAIVTVTGIGNYKGEKDVSFTIDKADAGLNFAENSVSKKLTDSTFTNDLTKATDGAVTFKSSNTGVAEIDSISGLVTIKGIGTATITASAAEGENYKAGSVDYILNVEEDKVDISDLTVTLAQTSYIYDGTSKQPAVTIRNDKTTLTVGTDYDIQYSNNTNAGTAFVKLIGLGCYEGEKIVPFTINKADAVLHFDKSSINKVTTDAKFSNTLTKTTDATVIYESSNTDVAVVDSTSGEVTIKWIGETIITANAAEGKNYKAGSESYLLTVTSPGIIVGDRVTASVDTNTGAVVLYSNDGTLWNEWIGKLGINRNKITSICAAETSGTIYFPDYSWSLFNDCARLKTIDFTHFDTSKMSTMGSMFSGCSSLTSLDLSSFDTTNVTDMGGMFSGCSSLTSLDLSGFDTTNVTGMGGMFSGCSSLTSLDLGGFDTTNVTGMGGMFSGCSSLTSLDLRNFDTSNVTYMGGMFSDCRKLTSLNLSKFDTSSVMEMGNMFSDCSNLGSLDLSSFDTSNVTDMRDMFVRCGNLKWLDLTSFDTSIVKDMGYMFSECKKLTSLNLSSFDTSNVTNMCSMFSECSSLTNLDLHNFDTSKVISMFLMFSDCSNLQSLDLSSFNTEKVEDMGCMFAHCQNLASLDLSSFNTSNVKEMWGMFMECKSLTSLDLSNFNTSSATDLSGMFNYCSELRSLDISGFSLTKAQKVPYLLLNCQNLCLLKTPRKTEFVIYLPEKMYDNAGKAYAQVPIFSKSITLTRKGGKFSDVQDPNHPYYKAIYWAAERGITKGYSDGTFGINRSCTRGEMMMFLWRYAGKPAATTVSKSPFSDVPKTHAFYKAILWGSQKGITKGYPNGTFGIDRNVSRGECMMFLWRLKGKPAPKAVAKAPFPDVPKSHVFYNAVLWGYQKKITTGFTSGKLKGKFGVNENCSRGQIVTFLYRAK